MKAITRELEETRKEYQAQIDKLKAEKGQGEAGLRRQLEDSRRQMEEQARAAARIFRGRDGEGRDCCSVARKASLQGRSRGGREAFTRIDRLKNIHSAALSAGSARGRSLLYAEAMKSPEVLKPPTMTWRGEDRGRRPQRQLADAPPEGLQYEYKPDDDTSPYTALSQEALRRGEVARPVASLYYREADNGAAAHAGRWAVLYAEGSYY